MTRKGLIQLLMMCAWALLPNILTAQEKWVDETYMLQTRPFLSSGNPAGLSVLDSLNFSQARLDMMKGNGGLVNYHESDDDWQISVRAASLYRFSPKIVMRGALCYAHTQGRHMSGSVFIDPYSNTFDLLETNSSNQGRKKKEKYQVTTEISYQVWKGLSLGAAFDFISANYSKMKDLRHSNDLSDLHLNLGASYSFSRRISIGAAYHFRKTVEGIAFERFSPGDLHHEILVSYGSFWGKRKSYEENMGQISQSKIPVLSRRHGGSIQIDLSPVRNLEIFLEGSCSTRNCNYGHKSPNTILYNTFSGLEYKVNAVALFKTSKHRHRLYFNMGGEPVTSYEMVWKTVHHGDGENETQYFDPKEVSRYDLRRYNIGYRADFKIGSNLPAGSFSLDFKTSDRQRLTTIYPYWRQERMQPFILDLKGKANCKFRKNLFTPQLQAAYAGQISSWMKEGSFIKDPTQTLPKSAPEMQDREHEYLTCPKTVISPSFRYSRSIRKFTFWCELDYTWLHALSPVEFVRSRDHHRFCISLGLDF